VREDFTKARTFIDFSYTFSMAMLASYLGPLLVVYSDSTGLTIDQLVAGMGYSYWAIGFSSVIFQPMSLAIGKRPVIVISALAGGLINMWTVYLSGNGSWIAQRFLLGLASGPSFALAEVVIADVVSHRVSSSSTR
jgi:MFS family permease